VSFTGPVDSLVYMQFMINVVGHNDADISYCVYSDIFEILAVECRSRLCECKMKMRAVWDIAPCSLNEMDLRFRGAYCFHHQGVSSPMIFKITIISLKRFNQQIFIIEARCVFFAVGTNFHNNLDTNVEFQKVI
jgi:hypothetical protein